MEQEKEFVGLFLPKHVIEDLSLSVMEVIIYAEIACFDLCYKSNQKIGERWGVSAGRVSQIISSLKKKGYVEQVYFDGRKRYLKAFLDKPIARQGTQKLRGRVRENCEAGYAKIDTIDNNIDNNIDIINKEASEIISMTLEYSLKSVFDYLEKEKSHIEILCMNYNLTQAVVFDFLKKFHIKLQNEGETKKSVKDAKAHFARWLNLELNKNKNERSIKKHENDSREREYTSTI